MAFALGTTAGAGTITVAAGSSTVTGVGTAFTALDIGRIFVAGAQWGAVATVASATSLTLDRGFNTAVSASAYSLSSTVSTAGTGTVSVAAGSAAVVGSGTPFTSEMVNRIMVVGTQFGFIQSVTNSTNITLDRVFATAVSGAAYTFLQTYPIITQSGTDTSSSALNTLAGVNSLSLGDAVINAPLNAQLNITGTLTLPGLTEKLVFNNQQDNSVGGARRDNDIRVSGTFTATLSSVVNGVTIYAPDFVYLSRRPSPSGGGGEHQLNTTGSSFFVTSTGTANLTGGTYQVRHNFAVDTGGRLNVVGSHLKGNGARFWMRTGSITTFVNCTIENFSIFFNAFPTNISGVTFKQCGTITKEVLPGAGFDAAPNVVLSPQWLATTSPIINIWGGSWLRVKNSTGGSSLGVLNTAPTPWASGIADFVQDVQFRVKNLSGAAVVGFKFSAIESNDGNRRNVRQYTGVGPFFDNTDIRTLSWTTAAGGLTNTVEARLQAGVTTLTPTTTPGSGGLVTTNYGQTSNDEYDVFGLGYGYLIYQKRIQFRANGAMLVDETVLPDTSITQYDPAAVAAYTTLNNNAELYDGAAYHLFANYARQTAFYVTRQGDAGSYNVIINQLAANVFTPTGSSIAIKTDDFSGDLTTSGSVILANGSIVSHSTVTAPNVLQDVPTNLAGVIITGNLIFNTNTPITVQFTDCDIQGAVSNTGSAQVNIVRVNTTIGTVGANVVAQQFATISAPNLLSGSRVRVYDEDNAVELFNGVLASAGFSQSFVYTVDTTITLSATYVSGVTAKRRLSATGILTATGATFLASQEDNAVYNGYARNGAAVSGFAADYVDTDINLSMAGNYLGENLYAWWVWNETTEEGMRRFFGGINALDAGHIQFDASRINLLLDNSTNLFIRQQDSVRISRSDGVYPARLVTTGGGGIHVNNNSNVYVGTVDVSSIANALATKPTLAQIESSTVLAKLEHLRDINDGVKKASKAIPHTTDLTP